MEEAIVYVIMKFLYIEWQIIHSGAHIIQAFADAPASMIPEGIV